MTRPPEREARPGRVLGLDLGEARIGVAISDDEQRLALPFGNVRAGAPQDLKAIAEIVADNDIVEVVVGHPLSLSGEVGASAHKAEEFAAALEAMLAVPVILQDERLTTVEADRALAATGMGGRRRRGAVDASAAAVMLQANLDRRR